MAVPKVLGFVGSARKGGNTETLVDEALRGARDAGAETERIRLSKLSIAPCLGCLACLESGACVQTDGFAEVREKMLASPLWFLGTPVYFFAPSGQLKTFIDRWISIPRERTDGKRALGIVALEDTTADTAKTTVEMLEQTVRERRMNFLGALVAPRLQDVGDAKKHPEHLQAAYEAGKQAVETLCAERGRRDAAPSRPEEHV